MLFNVAQLLREPVGSTRRHDIDDEVDVEGERHWMSGPVEMVRTDRGVLVRADLSGTGGAECSRCLASLEREIRLAFEDEYIQTADVSTGARIPVEGEPDALTINARHELDLGEAIRQYWVLSEPIQLLCRPDCAGLCPICGKNRNIEPCDCQPEDSRWASLQALREYRGR